MSADAAYHIGEPETREIEFVPPTPEQQQMLDMFFLQYKLNDLRSAAERVLESARPMGSSGAQKAVLSDALDRLQRAVEA